ncbi:MAG: transcription termination/antitermination protein NusA [Proteobacteria bacterium]|nr:transcription termination/antitermination protein NusA [Pseudomonadota bacterium]
MGKELLLVAKTVSNEKGVDIKVVFEAINAALEAATRKKAGLTGGIRVELDQKTGDYKTFRYWEVIAGDEAEEPDYQLTLVQAHERDPKLKVGSIIEEPMDSVEFGRISARTAMHAIIDRVRQAERQLIIEEYQKRVGTLITGQVKKSTRDCLYLDLGSNAEAVLLRSDMLPQEVFRPGDRVRALLYKVTPQVRGPQIYVSRTRPEMLIELFRIEVPEVGEEVIEIKGAARDPGVRAKIAVKTNDGRIDPIGACVGMRGSRVQAVSGELGGERIDIILWDANPAQLVINALSPAQVASIVVDEDKHSMDIAVSESQLSQAIGRNGQNVRLASELTSWELNVMSEAEFATKTQEESGKVVQVFVDQLGVDEEVAALLVEQGFTNIEEIAFVPEEELQAIEGFEPEVIQELRNRANDILLTKALISEEQLSDAEPAEDLLGMEGMERHLAYRLASHGIVTMEDLAEQSVDDLLAIATDMDQATAGRLIMKAREPWFNT